MENNDNTLGLVGRFANFTNELEADVTGVLAGFRDGISEMIAKAASVVGYRNETLIQQVESENRDLTGSVEVKLVKEKSLCGFLLSSRELTKAVKIHPTQYLATQYLMEDDKQMRSANLASGFGDAIELAERKLIQAKIYSARHPQNEMNDELKKAVNETRSVAEKFVTPQFLEEVRSSRISFKKNQP